MKSPGNGYIYVHPTSKGVKRFPRRLKSVFQEGIAIASKRTIFQSNFPSRKIIKYHHFPNFQSEKSQTTNPCKPPKNGTIFKQPKEKTVRVPPILLGGWDPKTWRIPWFNGGPLVDPFERPPFPHWGVYGTPSFPGSPSEGSSLASVPSKPHGKPWSLSHASSAPTTWTGRNGWWVHVRWTTRREKNCSEITKQHIFWGMRKIENRIYDIYIYIYIYICICTLYLKKLLLWITFCCFYQYLWSLLNISITSTGNG